MIIGKFNIYRTEMSVLYGRGVRKTSKVPGDGYYQKGLDPFEAENPVGMHTMFMVL